jgi:glycosyltransferase involved in cell wall biosynthesis
LRIVIASTYYPFVEGGGTRIVDDLHRELTARGFETDRVMIPFSPAWPTIPEQTLALRLLDLSESSGNRIDLLITIRTPSYALRHPNKVAWFIHHHREAYDLWGTSWGGMPDDDTGRRYRDMMRSSDSLYLRECRKVFTNSRIMADRLRNFNDFEPNGILYPPLPRSASFREGPFGDYLFYLSRVTSIKRQDLALEAMKYTAPDVRLVIGGTSEDDSYLNILRERARSMGLEDRVEFTGWLTEERKSELMAGCCGALYLAYLEDSYGYATLEAFHSGKPVITLSDCGGPLEVIEDGVNGLVAEPEPRALAKAMDRLWADRASGRRMGASARETPDRHRIHWDHVVESLTS